MKSHYINMALQQVNEVGGRLSKTKASSTGSLKNKNATKAM
jgi:hypothetical protein